MECRFRLRALAVEDIDDEYCSWYTNSDGHLDFFTGTGREFDADVLRDDFRRGLETGNWSYYVAEDLDVGGQRIGNVKIGPIDKKNGTSDLVCLIGNRDYVGKGLASRIIAAAGKIAFEELDIRRLHGGMYASHVASIKAYTRAGWYVEATFRGYYLRDGEPMDRVCVCCLNPKYFPDSASIV